MDLTRPFYAVNRYSHIMKMRTARNTAIEAKPRRGSRDNSVVQKAILDRAPARRSGLLVGYI